MNPLYSRTEGYEGVRCKVTTEDAKIKKHTVCFVCFAEDVVLKVLLLLHGGVKLRVVVLQQRDTHHRIKRCWHQINQFLAFQ